MRITIKMWHCLYAERHYSECMFLLLCKCHYPDSCGTSLNHLKLQYHGGTTFNLNYIGIPTVEIKLTSQNYGLVVEKA